MYIYMKFAANIVYALHIIFENCLFVSTIRHLHMPNLHIQTLKHVYANALYIWHSQRKNNTHIYIYSNDIWHADKQYNSDKNDPQLESCRHFMIFTQLKNNNIYILFITDPEGPMVRQF